MNRQNVRRRLGTNHLNGKALHREVSDGLGADFYGPARLRVKLRVK